MRARPALALAIAAGGAVALAVTAAAQVVGSEPTPPVLHKDVRSPRSLSAQPGPDNPPVTSARSVIGDDPAAGRNPAAIGTGDKILPEPSTSQPASREEPVLGRGGFGADRSTEFEPDAKTGADDTLQYVEAFNPAIVPFKRMSALDAVDDQYHLTVGDRTLTDVPVGGKPTAGWDRFWGSVLLDLEPGRDAPLPSVSPAMRILSYESEPPTQLTFSKDGADNFFVRSDEAGARGLHRLVFLVEADPVYFAPRVPRRVRVLEVARARGAPHIPPIPDHVRRMARNVHSRLRVSPTGYLRDSLDTLIRHFRAFEAKPYVQSDGGIYWDLTIQQAGVCRHRSFAFVITASALGIPARFVSNEAHAFTEVWVPEYGWIRVDLGGASNRLDVQNAEEKSMYRPRGEDPFPRPNAYTTGGYSTLDGTLTGLTPEQVAEGQTPRASSEGGGEGGEGGKGPDGDRTGDAAEPRLPSPGPGPGLPEIPPEALRNKKATRVSVLSASRVGFRGEAISVEGQVTAPGGAGIGDLRVDIYLAPAGQRGEGAHPVGSTISQPDGSFRAEVHVPYEVPLDRHEVYAGTQGSSDQQPAISR